MTDLHTQVVWQTVRRQCVAGCQVCPHISFKALHWQQLLTILSGLIKGDDA